MFAKFIPAQYEIYADFALYVTICVGLIYLVHHSMFPHDDGCGKVKPTRTRTINFFRRSRKKPKLLEKIQDGTSILGEDGYQP